MVRTRKRKTKIHSYFFILVSSLFFLSVGALVGFVFFRFFKDESVFIINKFKILQGFVGIREYKEGMSIVYAFIVILLGNLFSTIGYGVLGYLRTLIPVSLVSGFFIVIFLLSGTIRHSMALPVSMVILSSIEMFYRAMAMALGEYIQKRRALRRTLSKKVVTAILVIVFLLLMAGIAYELLLIYNPGYFT
ncbi:MAG: hypothetical protein H5T85_07440 [Actinobacteria bacterium]|nr:hypothetical protein [Actinomycetota bacterium]